MERKGNRKRKKRNQKSFIAGKKVLAKEHIKTKEQRGLTSDYKRFPLPPSLSPSFCQLIFEKENRQKARPRKKREEKSGRGPGPNKTRKIKIIFLFSSFVFLLGPRPVSRICQWLPNSKSQTICRPKKRKKWGDGRLCRGNLKAT